MKADRSPVWLPQQAVTKEPPEGHKGDQDANAASAPRIQPRLSTTTATSDLAPACTPQAVDGVTSVIRAAPWAVLPRDVVYSSEKLEVNA